MLRTLEIRHYGPVCDVSETGLYQLMLVELVSVNSSQAIEARDTALSVL